MHDDICSLGHEKCTALVIVPFQKSDTVYIRSVNKNVLDNDPVQLQSSLEAGCLFLLNFGNLNRCLSGLMILENGFHNFDFETYTEKYITLQVCDILGYNYG
ncbi:hypothetical protein ACOSQ3_029700 [Xanthoceras sorbifolium]